MKYICRRCSHQWIPRIDHKPAACPNCKSYKWEQDRPVVARGISMDDKKLDIGRVEIDKDQDWGS